MEPMLKVSDLNVYYGAIHAVKGVSFEVLPGEIVTLIGANGAGKTTILNTVAGLLHPASGTVEFEDKSLVNVSAHRIVNQGLALVPEGRRVFLQMTVEENLEMGAYTRPKEEAGYSLEKVFYQFPRLKERRSQVAGTLSGGEQQMLAMGRGIMSAPDLIMLDEPSLGLAPLLVNTIFDTIQEIKSMGKTILLVEQNALKALSVADKAYVLEQGCITMSGPGKELLKDPSIAEAYLGKAAE